MYHKRLCKSPWLNVTYSLGSGLRSGEVRQHRIWPETAAVAGSKLLRLTVKPQIIQNNYCSYNISLATKPVLTVIK